MQAFAEVCALCSDSHVEVKGGAYKAIGQPTEAALLVLAEKLGVPDAAEQQRILQERREQPEARPTGACAYYAARWGSLSRRSECLGLRKPGLTVDAKVHHLDHLLEFCHVRSHQL